MKILAIGNSFSQDATRYLAKIAKINGDDLQVATLYIGGCSLERHFRNLKSEQRAYELIWNGENTGFYLSIKEALLSRAWDVVTLQQQSLQSADYETFSPYLKLLSSEVKELCPKSKIYMHETWAYANGSAKLDSTKYSTHSEMFSDIKKSYKEAFKSINSDGIIPCGSLINELHATNKLLIHRDGYHLSYGLGRYAAGLLWYKTLFRKMPTAIPDFLLDEEITSSEKDILFKLLEQF